MKMLTLDELDFISEHHYTIRVSWIGPVEGYEYRISYRGCEKILAYRKSDRAAFNFIKRQVEKGMKNRMDYPTLQQVEKADRLQICRWYRFLPIPTLKRIKERGKPARYEEVPPDAQRIMDRIVERYKAFGGMNAQISKEIGFD